MAVAVDSSAAVGRFVWVLQGQDNVLDPTQGGGAMEYTFTVQEAGEYMIWGRVIAMSGSDDSFFVATDGGAHALWDTKRSDTEVWVWDRVSQRGGADLLCYTSAAVNHTLRVKQREEGTKLDKLLPELRPRRLSSAITVGRRRAGVRQGAARRRPGILVIC